MLKNRSLRTLLPPAAVGVVLLAALLAPARTGTFNGILACYSYAYQCGVPTVTNVSPNTGSTTGGDTVTITGTNFNNSGLVVRFGSTPAAAATINSDTQISATTPPHAAGTVDVTVTTSAGTSAISSADKFTFLAACSGVTINAVPNTVAYSASGGTHVTATANGINCPTSPRYEFWLRPASNPNWQMVQGYSTSNTYDGNSTSALPGTVYLGVHVKDAGSAQAYDAVASTPVTVTTPQCTKVT